MASLSDVVFNPHNQVQTSTEFNFDLAAGSVLTQVKGYTYNFDTGGVQAPYFQGKTVPERVILIAPAYETETPDGKGGFIKSTFPSSQIILNTILVDVSRNAIIQRTQIQGRDGAVTEYIGQDDWRLDFRGALVNHVTNEKPIEEMKLLVKILNAPVALQVVNDYIQTVYNINNIVVEPKTFDTIEGVANTQYFAFSAFSDTPLELNRIKISN